MSNSKDLKKKAKLEKKTLSKMFRFHVLFAKKTRLPELEEDDTTLNAEINALCDAGLAEDMEHLAVLVHRIKTTFGIEQEWDLDSLNGTLVPYILGITNANPCETGMYNSCLTKAEDIQLPLQVKLVFDNEFRNQVVEWVKSNHDSVTTRLYVPILKLQNMVVEFSRVVKRTSPSLNLSDGQKNKII